LAEKIDALQDNT